MDKDREYAEQWEVSSRYFYKQGMYEKLCDHIDKYNIVLEIGCGVGYSTLSLKEKGHRIISIEKNKECIKKAKKLLKENGVTVGTDINNFQNVDVIILNCDVAKTDFHKNIMPNLSYDIVICWNVGGAWDKNTLDFYLKEMIDYGLAIPDIYRYPESSYAELILYNSVKSASLKDVPIQIVERTKNGINENNIEYYCLLKKEFNFKEITYKNFNATSVSSGGRVLISEGVVNKDGVISIVLSSIILK